MEDLALRPVLRQFVEAVSLDELVSKDELASGLMQCEAELLRVGLDVLVAESRGIPLSSACRSDTEFPYLSRLHASIRDLLTLELPPPLVSWVRKLLARPERLNGNELEIALGRAAICPSREPVIRALARLLMFESIRAALLLVDYLPQASVNAVPASGAVSHREATGFAGVGLDDPGIDALAEREVTWWLSMAANFDGEVRPLTVLFAAALKEVEGQVEAMKLILSRANHEIVEELQVRDELERKLKRMNAPDAILVRNAAGPRLGEQRLTVERLKEAHPVAFDGRDRNALDQRLYRLADKMKANDWPERKSPALVDLIAQGSEEEETP